MVENDLTGRERVSSLYKDNNKSHVNAFHSVRETMLSVIQRCLSSSLETKGVRKGIVILIERGHSTGNASSSLHSVFNYASVLSLTKRIDVLLFRAIPSETFPFRISSFK